MTRLSRWIVWPVALAITAATLCPIQLRPTIAAAADLERLLAFTVLGTLLSVAYPRYRAITLLLTVGGTALLEWSQNFVQGRHGHLHDFDVKTIGVVVGVLFGAWLLRLWPVRSLKS